MGISKSLWQINQDLAQICLVHPFVQSLAKGNLARSRFAFYVAQDAFFLTAFARAYSIAAAKTRDREGFSRFHNLANGVLRELQLHESYAREWNIDLATVTPAPATRRYTDFLLATAWGSDVGLIAAAMTPCMRLYAFLGQELAKEGIPTHDYGEWIRTYSSSEFEELAQELESLSDRYTSDNQETRSTYRYALLCEENFFTAAGESKL